MPLEAEPIEVPAVEPDATEPELQLDMPLTTDADAQTGADTPPPLDGNLI
jgi:hypothetical protein